MVLLLNILFSSKLTARVNINCHIQISNRGCLEKEGKFIWDENQLGLKFEDNPSDKIRYYSEVCLRALGFPNVLTISDLQHREKDTVQPWVMELREAYIDVYGFLISNLNLRIGRQPIMWGTSDKLNLTDNLNPEDLQGIFVFGRHLVINAQFLHGFIHGCEYVNG